MASHKKVKKKKKTTYGLEKNQSIKSRNKQIVELASKKKKIKAAIIIIFHVLKEVEVNRSLMKNESFKNTQKELSNSEKENIYVSVQFSC